MRCGRISCRLCFAAPCVGIVTARISGACAAPFWETKSVFVTTNSVFVLPGPTLWLAYARYWQPGREVRRQGSGGEAPPARHAVCQPVHQRALPQGQRHRQPLSVLLRARKCSSKNICSSKNTNQNHYIEPRAHRPGFFVVGCFEYFFLSWKALLFDS